MSHVTVENLTKSVNLVDPVEMEWDEDNRQFVIRIDSIDGDRMIRWLRHGIESLGQCADSELQHLRR